MIGDLIYKNCNVWLHCLILWTQMKYPFHEKAEQMPCLLPEIIVTRASLYT